MLYLEWSPVLNWGVFSSIATVLKWNLVLLLNYFPALIFFDIVNMCDIKKRALIWHKKQKIDADLQTDQI